MTDEKLKTYLEKRKRFDEDYENFKDNATYQSYWIQSEVKLSSNNKLKVVLESLSSFITKDEIDELEDYFGFNMYDISYEFKRESRGLKINLTIEFYY